ncbi:nitrous oxide reductase family maturation protein NosD [Bacillus timonensis]|uniref:Nitrous oxide reductase family maturation protein NosD n=1 Tax=Bacillus timonensis TaxID=1033734 RepID=A0A4S3PV28_9BACI|nr:nitrous oxide reductase family maturation protein NosD [Bacillus timonensis]THE13246.1 nitrous oxide reductase family maturation protein NosD [Bacillus timonensis]
MKKLLFVLLVFLFCFPSLSFAENPLQELIDSAEEGTVLNLENRIYEGNITISKPLEIVGGKETIIKGDGTGNVISIHAPNVKLSHLTVRNGSMDRNSSEEYAAIKVYTDNNVLDDITTRDSFHGIYLSQAHDNVVKNCRMFGLGNGEIASQGNGLHVYYSNRNKLENNKIQGTRDGMFFDYANENDITHNEISKTRYGLHYMYSDSNRFSNNTFTFNTGGAAIMHSNGLTLSNNQFIFNYGHRSFGLLLLSSNQGTITDNTFFMNQRGLYIDQSTGNVIRHNQLVKNQIGIELWASSNEQIFTINQIDENTIPAITLGGQGQNSWSEDGVGNDWGSSFPLTDLDQNGVGDQSVTYYSSLHQLIEEQELTYLFLKSPAIIIYEKIQALVLHNETVMFEDASPIVQRATFGFRWIWMVVTVALVAVIFGKRRFHICTLFGRNGRNI